MTKSKKALLKMLDFYLKFPVLLDIALVILISSCTLILKNKGILRDFDVERLKSISSDLISTSISLAGFVLAALTIIVTFKDSATGKSSTDGKSTFFNSGKYFDLVKVFYSAALVLIFTFVILSTIKISDIFKNLKIEQYVILGALILICTSVLRSLILLFQIIKLQKNS
ncbi:MAG: hypothetical protein KA734_00930 [Fluviicola sp.]|nr:hypothetical protein [Fluviicola sp.]